MMKTTALCLSYIAALALTGCSETPHSTREGQSTTGIFISTNGETVRAIYTQATAPVPGSRVKLHFPHKTETELYQARSGSGTRYTNGPAEWWEHQGEAAYVVGGTNVFHGKLSTAQ